jgi:hypothetical protein
MGLDVYLEKIDNFAEQRRKEKEYIRHCEYLQKDSKETEEEMNIRWKKEEEYAIGLGLNKDGCIKTETVKLDSTKYPENMFKIGYFRSSYNGGGINSVLRNRGLGDLYTIFTPPDDFYFQPDWKQAKTNCLDLIQKYTESIQSCPYSVIRIFMFHGDPKLPASEHEALEIFQTQKLEHEKNGGHGFTEYSNFCGSFYLKDPMKVHAIINGKKNETYIITPSETKPNETDWYLQALEIVLETIDYVLAQPDQEKYYLAWSG